MRGLRPRTGDGRGEVGSGLGPVKIFLQVTSTRLSEWENALKAEVFARFFGTPVFLIGQTLVVAVWIGLNAIGVVKFDVYLFILLNLAFSLQAAYAAPLILLAQTRQADRDKAHAEADALHREAIATASAQREITAAEQTTRIVDLLEQNTQLTQLTRELGERIEALTREVHERMMRD